MKRGLVLMASVTCVLFACVAFNSKKDKLPAGSKGFAIIELFTSEGCSSCPPAELVAHNLIHKADSAGLKVYIVEFHVDYWDYLGWKDTFASPAYSQRQQAYGDFLKLNGVYTPQAVINGKSEMVGSDDAKINTTVTKELQSPSTIGIESKAHKTDSLKIEVTYAITGNISGCELNIAVTESDLTTYVKKGENARKTLTHDNVARILKSIKLNSATGKISLNVPHINLSHAKVICYLQNIENRTITGAAQVNIVQ